MPVWSRLKRYAPAIFFFGGFAWDALTLGRSIKPIDLFLLLGYLAAAAAILVLMGRGTEFRGSQYMNAVLQFLFGGVFSALFIFYFLSSSSVPGYLVVFGLAALLVGNEFLESAYSELSLSWAFFTLSSIMFFNFALAHLFRSIDTFWFYAGTLIALLSTLALRRWSKAESATIAPSIGVTVLILLLHAVNAIPPVPLVKKEMVVAHRVTKGESGYTALVESPQWQFWRASSPTFHRSGGERVYCFTAVFVPRGIETTIRHRWQVRRDGTWTDAGVIPFRIAGGRNTGYRGYTWKQNLEPGVWRVVAEAESGAAIGIVSFEVVPGEPQHARTIRL
jgi:hypothetical protein